MDKMHDDDLERSQWKARVECRYCAYQSLSIVLLILMFVWGIWLIGVPLGGMYCSVLADAGESDRISVQELRRISSCVADCCDDDAPTHPVECMERYNCVHACISPLLHNHHLVFSDLAARNESHYNNSESLSL